jgi:hypothetical protein
MHFKVISLQKRFLIHISDILTNNISSNVPTNFVAKKYFFPFHFSIFFYVQNEIPIYKINGFKKSVLVTTKSDFENS